MEEVAAAVVVAEYSRNLIPNPLLLSLQALQLTSGLSPVYPG